MPSRRPGVSLILVAGALVLLASIVIGQKLGDRVLLQTERRVPIIGSGVTPVPEVEPTSSEKALLKNWKRLQVVAVATDPAFPDPRVTKPPSPKPTPRPTPPPTLTIPPPSAAGPGGIYTSPPLPLPLVSHNPGEVETEPPTLSPEERANVAPTVRATPPIRPR